jgi:uncharacterized repeat protein (TIGR04138 family)
MQTISFEEVLDKILATDGRYQREAYHFLREALDHTQKRILRAPREEPRHVTGQQLLEGIREYALDRFGPLTVTVFDEWGIRRCEDFGDIVFNMVESSLLAKTDKDSREDFRNGYDFDEVFRRPFRPKATARDLPCSRPAPPAPTSHTRELT